MNRVCSFSVEAHTTLHSLVYQIHYIPWYIKYITFPGISNTLHSLVYQITERTQEPSQTLEFQKYETNFQRFRNTRKNSLSFRNTRKKYLSFRNTGQNFRVLEIRDKILEIQTYETYSNFCIYTTWDQGFNHVPLFIKFGSLCHRSLIFQISSNILDQLSEFEILMERLEIVVNINMMEKRVKKKMNKKC